MPARETKLFSVAFLVKKIKFESNDVINGPFTVDISFSKYSEQTIFEPVVRSSEDTQILNVGKSFTFGLSREMACALAKEFLIKINLLQADPKTILSTSQIDVTKYYREVFKENCNNSLATQVKTAVQFEDGSGKRIACMDIVMRISLSGPTIKNEFNLDGNTNNQFVSMTNGCGCPKVPELKLPTNKDHDDEGEWDVVCAELKNGQKLAIKYRRNYYEFKPSEFNKPCKRLDKIKTTESDEKLNARMLGLMEQMHKMISSNAKEM